VPFAIHVQSIRKQAADLRFILEAPQLEIGADERVTLPVLSDTTPTYRSAAGCCRNCVLLMHTHALY